jgi:hypothetical protein
VIDHVTIAVDAGQGCNFSAARVASTQGVVKLRRHVKLGRQRDIRPCNMQFILANIFITFSYAAEATSIREVTLSGIEICLYIYIP